MNIVDIETGEVLPQTAEGWAERIRSDWGRSVGGIVAAGRALTDAKSALSHGQWGRMFAPGLLPFKESTAKYLMGISRNEAIVNRQYTGDLPASWYTLAELSRLSPGQLESAIGAGDITADLGQKAAKRLVASLLGDTGHLDEPSVIFVPEGKFSAIVADPPWRYDNAGTRGSAEDHYPTMGLADICDLAEKVDEWAAEDSHLYLWTTSPFLREAFDVMAAWKFTYKTSLVWVKPQFGLGNYFRSAHEVVLFGVRGALPTNGKDVPSWFSADRQRHSAKPECFYSMVEKVSAGPFLEMFSRNPRENWSAWGNEL